MGADVTTVFAPPLLLGVGERYPLYGEIPKTIANFTDVTTTKNSLGNNVGSFGFHYWAKDPVTPAFATPSLDVHANFSIAENLDLGMLYVNASFTGDKFPSSEAFIQDQSGFKLFLGANKEVGGVPDLFGDNKQFLYNVNMQIKFDDKGNFLGVYDQENDTYIPPQDWNKKVESTWE